MLARQHLLSRSSATLPRALQSVGGLQAQYAPSMYVGLWSRRDLARADLTAALEQRAAVQATLMRVTDPRRRPRRLLAPGACDA